MKKVVIIGANDFQNPLILKAKENGYETHVFAWKDGSIGEKTADYFYPISIVEKEKILEECKKIKPDAVLTIASDLATVTVNYIAQELGLVGNSLDCTLKSTNKYEMRKAFKEAGVQVPEFTEVSENDLNNLKDKLENIKFPVIVKPTDRSGSRAITKVLKSEDLENAIKNAISNSFEKKAIIEEYIDGQEYSTECISFKGKHNFLATTKKFTTGAPNFIETAHIQPSGLDEVAIEKVKKVVFKALDALGVENGASHSEFRIDKNGDVRIIEIGARMGGDCIGSDLVKISTGYDFVQMVLDVALGSSPKFEKVSEPKIAYIKFIFGEKEVEELNKLKRENPEIIKFVSHIDEIGSHKIVDSSSRYGFFILAAENMDQIKEYIDC